MRVPTLRVHLSRIGYYPGVVAALLASTVMIVLGRVWNAPVPPQLLADRVTALLPVEIFGSLLGQFESSAKPITFVLLLLGQVVAGGLLGAALAPVVGRRGDSERLFGGVLLGLFAVLALVIAPIGGIGPFGTEATVGVATVVTSFFLVALTYASTLTLWLGGAVRRGSARIDVSRRRVVSVLALGIPALAAVGYLGRFFLELAQRSKVSDATRTEEGLVPALTPPGDFYVVSKNFVDPSVSPANWQLTIDGLVAKPRRYTYEELRTRRSVRHIATLECISNEVGGDYISNGEWTGFPLRELLDEAGVQPGVVDAVFYAEDDYSDSIPIQVALDPDTFLAHELGGQPLTKDHGFPVRLLIPNIYGMKNVKWLNRISLVDSDYKGYWQNRGWSDVATIQTMSRIDTPYVVTRVVTGQAVLVGGVAFAGRRGISRVQVSTDEGKSWNEARIEPPLSPLSWVRWKYSWTPPAPGRYKLTVRAADGSGAMQTDAVTPPLPDGATGYHQVTVRVAAPDS